MRYKYLITLMAVAVILFSCKKDNKTTPPPADAVLLKDIVINNLPSPYYHFEYTGEGKVAKASFSSGIRMYDVIYDGNRISELKSTTQTNKDRLQYLYDEAGKVDMIKYVNEAGAVYRFCSFTYVDGRLRLMEWERKVQAGFIIERTMAFVYDIDGNMLEITDHRLPVNGQTEGTHVTRFEQYDDKVNTDAFSIVHDSNNEHLLLLPGIELQKNNPGKVIFDAAGIAYTINYTYTYNDKKAPLTKLGNGIFTDGPNNGQTFQSNTTFTYY